MASGFNTETTSLLTPITPRKKTKCLSFGRLLALSLLLILVLVSLFINLKFQKMAAVIETERGQIEKLESAVQKQGAVIARFNESITGKDVMKSVNALGAHLETTETNMREELKNTQKRVNLKLNQTLDILTQNIIEAKADIHTEVLEVKLDIKDYQAKTTDQFSTENDFMVYQLAGTFTIIGCLISMWHMTDHIRHMNAPHVQRKILAILWMAPIYSVTSWFSLVFSSAEGYLGILKDFYEAYCIYTFLSFIIAVLGRGDREAVVTKLALHADHLSPPFRLCGCLYPDPYKNARAMAHAVLLQCQIFTMQFVFFHPFTSFVKFILNSNQYYGGGTSSSDYRSPQFYLTIIDNVSVFTAFAGLLKIYHAVQGDLQWLRPLPKFLCIKGVVFMTFWQGLVIGILARTTGEKTDEEIANGGNEEDNWAARAQSFLICLEMLLFSVAHFYVFPVEEWDPNYKPVEKDGKFGDNMALGDFLSDLRLVVGSNKKKKKRKTRRTRSGSIASHTTYDTIRSNSNFDSFEGGGSGIPAEINSETKDGVSVKNHERALDFSNEIAIDSAITLQNGDTNLIHLNEPLTHSGDDAADEDIDYSENFKEREGNLTFENIEEGGFMCDYRFNQSTMSNELDDVENDTTSSDSDYYPDNDSDHSEDGSDSSDEELGHDNNGEEAESDGITDTLLAISATGSPEVKEATERMLSSKVLEAIESTNDSVDKDDIESPFVEIKLAVSNNGADKDTIESLIAEIKPVLSNDDVDKDEIESPIAEIRTAVMRSISTMEPESYPEPKPHVGEHTSLPGGNTDNQTPSQNKA